MEDAVNVSTAKDRGDIEVAGAGYAGLQSPCASRPSCATTPGWS
jgi:hypothetical protein